MKRTIYTFDNIVVKRLENLARKKFTNKCEILRRAITLYDFLQNESNGRIRFKNSNGEKIVLILP